MEATSSLDDSNVPPRATTFSLAEDAWEGRKSICTPSIPNSVHTGDLLLQSEQDWMRPWGGALVL